MPSSNGFTREFFVIFLICVFCTFSFFSWLASPVIYIIYCFLRPPPKKPLWICLQVLLFFCFLTHIFSFIFNNFLLLVYLPYFSFVNSFNQVLNFFLLILSLYKTTFFCLISYLNIFLSVCI